MQENTKRKIIRSACHASALFSWAVVSAGLPIAVLFLSNDPLTKDSAKEALNFSISMLVIAIIGVGLCLTVIGLPVGLLLLGYYGLASFILPIVAIASVCADSDRAYRYPFTIRLIKPTINAESRIGQAWS